MPTGFGPSCTSSFPWSSPRPGVLEEIGAGIVRHGDNQRYAWAIGDRAQRRRTTMAMVPRPYPTHRDP